MTRRRITTIATLAAMVAMIQTAQASFTGYLYDLATGHGSLNIGDKTFSDFSYLQSGLNGFDAHSITVTASHVGQMYFLTFAGNMQLSGYGRTADLLLNYTVTASAGQITRIGQVYTGGAANANLLINETATSSGAPTASSQLSRGYVNDPSDPNVYPYGPITQIDINELDLLTITPGQPVLHVTKDIAFATESQGGFVSLSQVQQSFQQVPEPTTMIAGALLLLPFGASTLRMLRRRTAGALIK